MHGVKDNSPKRYDKYVIIYNEEEGRPVLK